MHRVAELLMPAVTAEQLAASIGARVQGDPGVELTGCATLDEAGPGDLSFLANRKYVPLLGRTAASAVVLAEADAPAAGDRTVLIANAPYYAFREAMIQLVGFRPQPEPGVSPLASIDPAATIGPGCYIGPFAVVEAGAVVGDGSVLYPHCVIGRGARVGRDCLLYPHVVIYDRCILGDRVTLHAGCVIGQDGFGYATHRGVHHKIPQAGNAVVEDDVEMGANCSVDRATLGSTVIGKGTKFSNSVTIGHGSRVGAHNLFVAQVGLAGSVETGRYVAMGGQVGVAGHLKIGDQVQIAATSGVMHDIPDEAVYGGAPAQPFAEVKRQILHAKRLPELAVSVKRLQRRIDQLEKQLAAKAADTGDAG